MLLSKKEISILIEIVYSIVFALIFLPYFYENQEKNLILMDGLVEKIIQIIIFCIRGCF
jgi:ABC-type thiamin/hydroxymethylpyrimidine transport system permease subunit